MKLNIFIIGLMVCLIVLTACSSNQEQIDTTNNPLMSKEVNSYGRLQNDKESNSPQETVAINPKNYAKNVADLIEKSKKYSNYAYSFKSSIINNFANYDEIYYKVEIKDDLVKKEYTSPIKIPNTNNFYNQVYLNLKDKSAFAICSGTYTLCEDMVNAFKLDYDLEKLATLPLEIMQQIPVDAAEIGAEVIDNRKTTILEYVNKDGNLEKISVDNYYGIPLKRIIYKIVNEEEVILERYTFLNLKVGNIKSVDVTLPTSYPIVE